MSDAQRVYLDIAHREATLLIEALGICQMQKKIICGRSQRVAQTPRRPCALAQKPRPPVPPARAPKDLKTLRMEHQRAESLRHGKSFIERAPVLTSWLHN